jgi:hypothetical protein
MRILIRTTTMHPLSCLLSIHNIQSPQRRTRLAALTFAIRRTSLPQPFAKHLPAVPQTQEEPTKQTSDSLPPFPQTPSPNSNSEHAMQTNPALTRVWTGWGSSLTFAPALIAVKP